MPIVKSDGIDRANARNMRLTETELGDTQQHNEREKDSNANQNTVPERTPLNVHLNIHRTARKISRACLLEWRLFGVMATQAVSTTMPFDQGRPQVIDVNSTYCYKIRLP